MASDMLFLCAKTTKNSVWTAHRAGILLAAGMLLSACAADDRLPEISQTAVGDLHALGTDHAVIAGVRASKFYRSFVGHLDEAITLEEGSISSLGDSFLEQLGIDPETHDMSIYGFVESHDEQTTVGAILRAPIPENILLDLEAEAERVVRDAGVSGAMRGEADLFAVNADPARVFFTRASDGVLAASNSLADVESMLERSHQIPAEISDGLVYSVAGADFWLVANDLGLFTEEQSTTPLPEEISQILRSVVALGAAAELTEDAVWLNLFLQPRAGIDKRDISGLVKGGMAVLKMQLEDDGILSDILDRVRVSEQGPFSRVQIKISESDLEELIESVSGR